VKSHKFGVKLKWTLQTLALSRRSPQLPPWATWLVAAAWAAGVGYLGSLALVLILGQELAATGQSSVLLWLASHQATLISPVGAISLLPLGLTAVVLLIWRRAGRWLDVQSLSRKGSRRGTVILCVATYVAIAVAAAFATGSNEIHASVFATVVGATSFALLGIWWGFRKEAPDRLRLPNAVAGGAVAAAWFVLVGAVVIVIAVIFGFAEMGPARQGLSDDLVGQLGVLAVEIAYLPNLVLWAAAYATGSGFATGGEQVVSPFATGPVVLPDLPILAVIPSEQPSWTAMLPIVILVGGWVAAVVAQRRAPVRGLKRRLVRAGVLAGLVWVFWVVAGALASGSLGDGRLEQVGPVFGTAFIAAVLIGVGAVIWALVPTLAADAKPVASDLRERIDRSSSFEWPFGKKSDRPEGSPRGRSSKKADSFSQ
jgi:hypothetical protein